MLTSQSPNKSYSYSFEGDAEACGKWLGHAKVKLDYMLKHFAGTQTYRFEPTDGVRVRVTTRPNHIRIVAGGVFVTVKDWETIADRNYVLYDKYPLKPLYKTEFKVGDARFPYYNSAFEIENELLPYTNEPFMRYGHWYNKGRALSWENTAPVVFSSGFAVGVRDNLSTISVRGKSYPIFSRDGVVFAAAFVNGRDAGFPGDKIIVFSYLTGALYFDLYSYKITASGLNMTLLQTLNTPIGAGGEVYQAEFSKDSSALYLMYVHDSSGIDGGFSTRSSGITRIAKVVNFLTTPVLTNIKTLYNADMNFEMSNSVSYTFNTFYQVYFKLQQISLMGGLGYGYKGLDIAESQVGKPLRMKVIGDKLHYLYTKKVVSDASYMYTSETVIFSSPFQATLPGDITHEAMTYTQKIELWWGVHDLTTNVTAHNYKKIADLSSNKHYAINTNPAHAIDGSSTDSDIGFFIADFDPEHGICLYGITTSTVDVDPVGIWQLDNASLDSTVPYPIVFSSTYSVKNILFINDANVTLSEDVVSYTDSFEEANILNGDNYAFKYAGNSQSPLLTSAARTGSVSFQGSGSVPTAPIISDGAYNEVYAVRFSQDSYSATFPLGANNGKVLYCPIKYVENQLKVISARQSIPDALNKCFTVSANVSVDPGITVPYTVINQGAITTSPADLLWHHGASLTSI